MVSRVTIRVSAVTDVGRARTTNEDAYAVTDLASGLPLDARGGDPPIDVQERGVLLALSDGMGGHEAGEVASALVLESLQSSLRDETGDPIHQQLEQGVLRANRTVKSASKTRSRNRMGATLTAVLMRGGEAYIAEVGDSRAYLLRNGRLRQITRDQSLVQMLIDQGVLSPEQARRAPGKNVILQAVGLADDVRVAIARLELRRNDRFLLCSDGVSNAVSDDELRQILADSDPRAACETMIALANDRGGEDNQTAIVADLAGDGLELPDEFETVTSTFEVLKAYEATLNGRPVTTSEAHVAARKIGVTTSLVPPDDEDDDDEDEQGDAAPDDAAPDAAATDASAAATSAPPAPAPVAAPTRARTPAMWLLLLGVVLSIAAVIAWSSW